MQKYIYTADVFDFWKVIADYNIDSLFPNDLVSSGKNFVPHHLCGESKTFIQN